MKKHEGIRGIHARDGTVILTYNSQQGYSNSEGGKLLPCNTCQDVYTVEQNVVSFSCPECAQHRETCDDEDCTHAVHGMKNCSTMSTRDAATQTGMYDRE